MAYIADILMAIEFTKPLPKGHKPSAEPLFSYLKNGRRMTDVLRDLLVSLLDENGDNQFRLKLHHRHRRPRGEKTSAFYAMCIRVCWN